MIPNKGAGLALKQSNTKVCFVKFSAFYKF